MKPLILLPAIALLFASCAKDDAIAPIAAASKIQSSEAVPLADAHKVQATVAVPSTEGKIQSSEAVQLAPAHKIQSSEAVQLAPASKIQSNEAVQLGHVGKVQSSIAVAASDASDRAVQRCDAAMHALLGRKWNLRSLDGQQLSIPAGVQRPWLELTAAHGYRLDGFGGCNRIVGSFEPGCGTLQFSDLARTHIYCPATYLQEGQILAALSATDAFVIEGHELVLLAGGEEVARFSNHDWSDIPAMQNDISADPAVRTPPTAPELAN